MCGGETFQIINFLSTNSILVAIDLVACEETFKSAYTFVFQIVNTSYGNFTIAKALLQMSFLSK